MILDAKDVHKSYTVAGSRTDVLRGVSVSLSAGESLALMGESGSGKSTMFPWLSGNENMEPLAILE